MKLNNIKNSSQFESIISFKSVLILTSIWLMSGCAAKYHTVKKDDSEGAFSSQNAANGASSTPTIRTPTPERTDIKAPPTADIEVISENKSVTQVFSGAKFIIRPTKETLDVDDKDQPNCLNPGIVKARYQIESASGKIVGQFEEKSRPNGNCTTSLGLEKSLKDLGFYRLKLEVTSNEGETAVASMTLSVVASESPLTASQGFVIGASPLVSSVGSEFVFEGNCPSGKKVVWNFGDKNTRNEDKSGPDYEAVHAYQEVGHYTVSAVCTRSDETDADASIMVVVLPEVEDQVDILSTAKPLGPTGPISTFGGSTMTNTSIGTNTSPGTSTNTGTNTEINTNTGTGTNTSTNTETNTNTGTGTNTSTNTGTNTNTGTATNTGTNTNTGTATNTETGTNTGTSTGTGTNTGTQKCVPENTTHSYFICPKP